MESPELPKISSPGLNWDVLSNRNEFRAEIPQKPGVLGEFLLQVWLNLHKTNPTQTATTLSVRAPGGSELPAASFPCLSQALSPLVLLGVAEHTSMCELLQKLPTQGQLFSWRSPIYRTAVGVCEGAGDPSQAQLL